MNRFPLLLNLTANLRMSGDTFTEQEADAEDKLEELKWTEHGGTPQDLQQILAKETDLINMEMIDFLLKWEDEARCDLFRRKFLEAVAVSHRLDELIDFRPV